MNHPDMFKDLDSRVLQALEQNHVTLKRIVEATSLKERVVDRALQRLRKQGKIVHRTWFGWVVKKQKGEEAMSRVEDLTEEEKLALKKVLTDYPESKGWKHSSVVFGYLIALGFSPLKANQLQGEYLEGERHHGQSHQQGR